MDDYTKDEERFNQAAIVIQRRWREFQVEHGSGDVVAGGGHDNGASLFDKERTEEEVREELIDKCRSLLDRRESLREANLAHQKVLCKIFAEKRGTAHGVEQQPLTADNDTRYWDAIRRLRGDRTDVEMHIVQLDGTVDSIRGKHDDLMREAGVQEVAFKDYIRLKVAEATGGAFVPVGSTSPSRQAPDGPRRRLPKGAQEEFERLDDETQVELRGARVHYIRLRNRLKRQLREIEGRERGKGKDNGMHLIDYEQLKIENTNLNEKIEERNEELLKLRKKATTTIHILTHVKEKLEYIRNENSSLQRQVGTMEETLTALRDKLNHSKRERDHFANENIHMREKMPMIGSEDLLLDYEVRKKEIEACRISIVDLTNKHHQLIQWISTHQPLLDTMQASVV